MGAPEGTRRFRKILVGVDFSAHSGRALDRALELARTVGAEVHALHTCPLLAYALGDEHPDAPDFEHRVHARVDEELARLRERVAASGATLHTHRVDGSPGPQVAAFADQIGADLIVVGTHGRTGFDRVLLGSVAERVLRLAHVPVLAVP